MEQQPKPDSKKYSDLISEVEKGKIKIPKFQRNFVWALDKTVQLLDSILKGYPIGTFILWETSEGLNSAKKIGDSHFEQVPAGVKVEYVLDGQQRITSLYAAYKGVEITKEGEKKSTDYSEIYVNLEGDINNNDEQIVVAGRPEGESAENFITLHKVLNFTEHAEELVSEYPQHYFKKISQYFRVFSTYDFSTVVLRKEDMDSAIEVFTRINTGGETLTLFEIMSAKTYDEEKNFDMARSFQEFRDELDSKGKEYETISSSVVLYLLPFILNKKECKRKIILKLKKEEIIDSWDTAISAIKSCIDYFRSAYHIRASSILPYDSLIVPFAYFIHKNGEPEGRQADLLREFFWKVSLSHRYSSGAESKLAQDIRRIETIAKGNVPDYDDVKVSFEVEDLIHTNFSAGDSYCKAVLCLLAAQKPTDFLNSEKEVFLDNSQLKSANSKNYHHFFPKAYLRGKKIALENSIVNITLVGEHMNKSEIGAKAPSKYIGSFLKRNDKLQKSIKSHLIEDIESFGIMDDDYEVFLQKRAGVIHRELKKRLTPQK